MIIGYARVSGSDQQISRQGESLKNYGCERIYKDESTGKNFNRPEYNELKRSIRPGDTLVVHEFDRLGRNKNLTLKELRYFQKMNVKVIALNLPTMANPENNVMLETINNIIIELYTMMAQQELEIREKRQREGIDQALKRGVKFGREAVVYPDAWEQVQEMVSNKVISNVKAMEMLGLKKTTYFKLKKQWEEDN